MSEKLQKKLDLHLLVPPQVRSSQVPSVEYLFINDFLTRSTDAILVL